MENNNKNIFRIVMVAASIVILQTSCVKDVLRQAPTVDLAQSAFWQTEADATIGLNGLYAAVRPCFDRDYYFDGQAEYTRVRGTSSTDGNLRLGDAYNGGNYNPTGYGASFDKMFRYLYGAVNRANYVIENTQKLINDGVPGSLSNYEQIIGEARFLRGMVYFRLITMWGDIPYLDKVYFDNSEVALKGRIPMAQVKDSIMADFNYAFVKLPASTTSAGRATKPAVLAFRGKLQLYWASWNRFGWPELEGFKPDAAAATAGYTAAAADFKAVATNYNLSLYLNGDPGEIDDLGKADKLPNYYYLFTPKANGSGEMILAFNHGGTNSNQGEELMRDFAGRSHEGSQCWVSPRYEIADRYQQLTTGEFAPRLIPMNPTVTGSTARTALNSAVNPASYANRDYRMKASIQWDYETSVGLASL
ncbi:MAG: RagB/SusD family nutrient uptake outer membrane protein, partial [Chitinophagaceae bacterium]